jgi:hypothetical protein
VPESGVLARRNLETSARLSTRGGRIYDVPVHSTCSAMPRRGHLGSGRSYRALALIFRSRAFSSRDAFGRTLQPTLSKTSTRVRCGCRPADENESRVERRALCFNGSKARFWPAFPAAAGERSRFAHARIQGRPLAPRHLPRFDCARSTGTASSRPIQIASTDCHVEWQRLSRPKTPSIDKEPGRLFTLTAIHFQDWRERSRRSFTHCGLTAPG